MNFREQLEQGQSKSLTNVIVNKICNSPQKMEELMDCFTDGSTQITQRAAWSMSEIAKKHPHLLLPYISLLVDLLNKPNNHNAINRNILRAFQFMSIPKKHQGNVLNRCFELLNGSNEPIATKVFSMTVIFNLSKQYPEIIPELKASIEALMPNASAGIKSRGNKILTAIQKQEHLSFS